MLEKFDVLVVGAGTAGCLAAKTVAEAGLKVCLVERKRREEVGEKVCGDALGEHHLKTLGLESSCSLLWFSVVILVLSWLLWGEQC